MLQLVQMEFVALDVQILCVHWILFSVPVQRQHTRRHTTPNMQFDPPFRLRCLKKRKKKSHYHMFAPSQIMNCVWKIWKQFIWMNNISMKLTENRKITQQYTNNESMYKLQWKQKLKTLYCWWMVYWCVLMCVCVLLWCNMSFDVDFHVLLMICLFLLLLLCTK